MHRPFLIAAPLLVLAGCADPAAQQNADAQAAATIDNRDADLTPEKAGIFDTLLGGGKPLPLNIQQNHPNGGVLKLNSIQVKPTETVVNMTYVNGHTNDVQLDWASKKTYLFADGRKFFLSPPVGDDDVRVRSGATMTGNMVFMGAVPQTSQLQLIINDSMSRDSEYSSTPGFIVEIPVTTAAYSDDGSKKKLAALAASIPPARG